MPEGNSHFLLALERIDGGHVIEVADEKLREVLDAVTRTGKKGTLTIQLVLEPNGDRGIKAGAKVSASAPMLQFGQSFFFRDANGDLTRNAPDMRQMHFRTLGKEDVSNG